jgi:hypothetical protein
MFGLFRRRKREQPSSDPIARVAAHLEAMGYKLTPYGVGVALLGAQSGYSEVETASHIALTTMARDIKEAGTDIAKLIAFLPHGRAILEMLKQYKDAGLMHPTQWQNDANAFYGIMMVNAHQQEWVDQVLSDLVAGKERLATRCIKYASDDR